MSYRMTVYGKEYGPPRTLQEAIQVMTANAPLVRGLGFRLVKRS